MRCAQLPSSNVKGPGLSIQFVVIFYLLPLFHSQLAMCFSFWNMNSSRLKSHHRH